MKVPHLLKIVLIISLAGMYLPAFSSGNDSSKQRSFSREKIEDFKKIKDFKYAQPPKFDPLKRGIMTRIASWLASLLVKVPLGVWKFIPYLLMTAAVVLIIFYIRKVTLSGVVSGNNPQVRQGEVSEDNIHTLDFDKVIIEAIAKGQLRLAVRLYFLKTLKFLDDKRLIKHSREKTNREYLVELRDSPVRDDFRWLCRSFEFIWYGNMNPEQQRFEEIRMRYENFLRLISGSVSR